MSPSMNRAPNKQPDSNIKLVPKQEPDSLNDQIMDLNAQLKIFNKDPGRNADLIKEVGDKMKKMQDERDAKGAAKFDLIKKSAGGWNDADVDGDPLKRGMRLR